MAESLTRDEILLLMKGLNFVHGSLTAREREVSAGLAFKLGALTADAMPDGTAAVQVTEDSHEG